MKLTKLFLITLFTLFSVSVNAQSFTRKGNNFEQVTNNSTATATKTDYTWTDTKGNTYPIYITKTGRCFVNKVSSKTGKDYKYYLKEDISRIICKELNIIYQEKK